MVVPSPTSLALVAVGGALGTLARYVVAGLMTAGTVSWGIVTVNATGSAALGFLLAREVAAGSLGSNVWLLLGVGFLGAYTTMSTFAVDTFVLLDEGAWARVALNVLMNPVLAVVGAWLGWLAGHPS